ncbi:type II toxin-antitoxin system RelE/ParE family toxin [Thiomicrospira sp. R3]|uniref:type II toxin-antitoxin system RelE/ParE family toxin n=1 Tax=Thiomicrospira sp. R3 TaxID=3035472 RepID=UPI00259B6F6B|nr:type II toxin-antitoxin system RelE/ParE family toxin [Thiomicrospira sp. R3]WFE69191.1 type II toxin-antitoxin system RelE/ParE family toxin [Thiomicrospira sp. R3]
MLGLSVGRIVESLIHINELCTLDLLGFLDGDQVVILNHGFQKKTQKTPKKELLIAEVRKEDYLNRKQRS